MGIVAAQGAGDGYESANVIYFGKEILSCVNIENRLGLERGSIEYIEIYGDGSFKIGSRDKLGVEDIEVIESMYGIKEMDEARFLSNIEAGSFGGS